METRHIRIDFDEALSVKKNILNMELETLRLLKRLKAYKMLRKKELAQINKLKSTYGSLKSKVSSLESTFPEEERPRTPRKRREHKAKAKKETKHHKSALQKELDEIKDKLSRLQ